MLNMWNHNVYFKLHTICMSKKFVESNGEIIEVPKYASGVVGQQPIFKPESWFEYQSGVTLKSGGPGTMQGAFAFTRFVSD
jgi:uncharacterized protein affecting Mg2+/Co2+ transport